MKPAPVFAGAAAFNVSLSRAVAWHAGRETDASLLRSHGAALFVCALTGHTVGLRDLFCELKGQEKPLLVVWRATVPGVIFRGALCNTVRCDTIGNLRCLASPFSTPKLWQRFERARVTL